MRRRIVQSGLVVVVALAGLAGGAASAAGGGWVLPATPLAPLPAFGPSDAVVAVDAAGDALAAWTDDDGAGTQSLLVATRPAGGAWSAPQALASDVGVDAPAVALDAAGNATVAWVESPDGSAFAARAARRPAAGGAWGAPHDFPAVGGADPLTQVRADAAGNVVAAWVEHDPDTGVAFVRAAVATSGGAWSAPQTLSDPGDASVAFGRPQIAPGASGGALVGWTAQKLADPFEFAIQTSAHAGGGAWSAPADLLTTDEAISPLWLVGADGGDAVATWFQGSPAVLWGAMRTGGSWTVDDVSADVAPACVPLQALGADAGGGATVVWKAQSTGGLESVRLTAGGWEASATVFATGAESAEDVAIDHGTVALVAYDPGTDADSVLGVRRDGAGWSAPALLASPGAGTIAGALDLASDADGDALAGWTATDALGAKAPAAVAFQAAGPRLSDVSVPATGAVGDQLAFSVTARSAFATVAQTSWDFGDGSPAATGPAVEHAYAQAGGYDVTVTSVDSLGNASQATRQISVAQPSDGNPPGGNPPGGTPPPGTTPPGATPPGTTPPGATPPGSEPPAKPPALVRPRLGGARNGVFVLARDARTLKPTVRNLDAAASLRGSVTLSRPRGDELPALTLASRHRVAFAAGRRTAVSLCLTDQALRALRRASGHRLPVRLTLHLRAPDGRRVSATLTATLDAAARFGGAVPARTPAARMAC